MRGWVAGLAVAIILMPLGAGAGMKSILRFEQKEKPVPAEPAREEPATPFPGAEESVPPVPGKGASPGDVGGRADWYGETFRTDGAAGREEGSGEENASGLPGAPAEEDEKVPVPRPAGRVRSMPVAPPPELPVAAPGPRPASRAGTPRALPSTPPLGLPPRAEPFNYMPSPPGAVTTRGYDPSLAPVGAVRLPPPPAGGQPSARPRVLPRLAPYGTSLPPDQSVPPAAVPR